jgi:hypothetical protein
MKNMTILITPAEIHTYMRALFRTDDFRQSYDRGGLVYQAVDKFAAHPKFFYEMTDRTLEYGHFTSWWGGMQLRPDEYKQDAIHDLYYLHEITHAGTMPVHPGLQYDTFMQILGDNEADASVTSEIAAYFDMPDLRKKSFPFAIYADRFLHDLVYQQWWAGNQQDFTESMKYKRRNLMHPDYVPTDSPETWIHNFAAQNMALGPVWKDRVNDVVSMIWAMRTGCRDPQIGPARAMQTQMDYLLSDPVSEGTAIPFVREAQAAAPIIWANKTKYADSLKADTQATTPVIRPPAP